MNQIFTIEFVLSIANKVHDDFAYVLLLFLWMILEIEYHFGMIA